MLWNSVPQAETALFSDVHREITDTMAPSSRTFREFEKTDPDMVCRASTFDRKACMKRRD